MRKGLLSTCINNCRESGKRKGRLFSVASSDKGRGSEHKLTHRRFPLKVREHLFTVQLSERLYRLPKEVGEARGMGQVHFGGHA